MKRLSFLRLISTAAVALVCLSVLSACSGNNDGETTQPDEAATGSGVFEIEYNELRLPFSKADTLDPFKAESMMNRQLTALLYDGLFRADKRYEAVPEIADRYTLDGTSLTVSLSSGIVFTDGAYITSDDVAYSFKCAKDSDAYAVRLENFDKVARADSDTLVFTLETNDKYAASCLDFPIVKQGTVQDDYEALADVKPPVGSGRYVFVDGASPMLAVNNSRLGSFWPGISSIRLVNVSDSSALFYSLEIGNICFAFDDLSTGKYTRANADSTEYLMNNMVFLGFNAENASLGSPAVRRAIELAIDRTDIVETAFQGHAQAAYSPFNPDWYVADGDFTFKSSLEKAKVVLEDAGYDQINTYDIRNDGSKSLTFGMIVNKDNAFKLQTAKLIAGTLAKLNIHVSVAALSPEDYYAAYDALEFDLYIGEVNLTENMSIMPFFDGALSKGVYSDAAEDAYKSFAAGDLTAAKYANAFREETPFVPICFRKGIVACTRRLTGAIDAWAGDIFGNIENWQFE